MKSTEKANRRLLIVGFASLLCLAAIVGLRADTSADGWPKLTTCSLHEQEAFYDSSLSAEVNADDVGVITYAWNGSNFTFTTTNTFRIPSVALPAVVCYYSGSGTSTVNGDGSGTSTLTGLATSTSPAECVSPFTATTAFVLSDNGKVQNYVYTSFVAPGIIGFIGSGQCTSQWQ